MLGGCSGEKHRRGSLSSLPLPLVTLTLLGILPALGCRSALSPRGAYTAQLPPRGPATSPNGRNSPRARDNNNKKTAAHLNAPSSQARHMLSVNDTAPQPRTPFVGVAMPGGRSGGNEGRTSAHHRNVGWQDGVLFHYKASLKPLSKQPSPKYACLSFSASASNCHPAPRRARNAEQADSQGEDAPGHAPRNKWGTPLGKSCDGGSRAGW